MKSRRHVRKLASVAHARNHPDRAQSKSEETPLIVGVGASAGGLQAFTQLLRHLPGDPGMALVLIQHLAPKHKSALTELLGRTTAMPVAEVTDGMCLQNNHVYAIPPDHDMEVRRGRLHLLPRASRQPHMPIDYFFSSMAEDQGVKSMGAVFSGTASDGTLGLKAIRAAGGITFAQEPERANHSEMPRNAIAAGCVDFVLPVERIAKELLRIAHHPYIRQPAQEKGEEAPTKGESELRKIYRILRGATGVDFTHYKPSTIRRRVRRRMILLKLDSLKAYTNYLQAHRDEVDALFQDVLIHVTGFFRDPEAFEVLKTRVFPKLVEGRSQGTPIRIWVVGCSTGEEVYSLAIVLLEYLAESPVAHDIQIFATDVNDDALEKARQGEYLENIATEVSQERLRRFFIKAPHGYRVNKALREMCVFARHDIAKDPPFSHIDLVTCRNLLIYLGLVLQKRILPIFHYALKPSGYLMLGGSETIGSFAEYFTLLDKKHKLYAAKPSERTPILEFGGRPYFNAELPGRHGEGVASFDLEKEADRILLGRYSPPGVIIGEDFQILNFRGRTGRYLEPAPGQASLNLAKMVREGLSVDLRAALQEARKHQKVVRKHGLEIKRNAHTVAVNLEVIPIKGPLTSTKYFLVLFQDAVKVPADSEKRGKGAALHPVRAASERHQITRLRDELAQNKTTLQSTIEDLEATNEELRSANEEILSSNEELQSTNEELETAKEELQSANEELTTVNEELQNRTSELSTANNDLLNLLGTINIPILMLGNDLRIRWFTADAQRLVNVVRADIGRPVGEVKMKFELPGFEQMIADAIDNIAVKELQVQNSEGCWYSMRIRPYKTAENKIEGAIISWIEVTGWKAALDESTQRYRFLFERNLAGVFYARQGRILDCNDAFARILGYSSREGVLQLENVGSHLSSKDQEDIYRRIREGRDVDNAQIAIKRKDGSQAWVVASAGLAEEGGTVGIVVDITRQVHAEELLGKLTKSLMKASDERRRELARELHDQVGSRLAGLLATLTSLHRTKGIEEKIRNELSKVRAELQECTREIQTVSYLQHPLVIDNMGLIPAVRTYIEDFSRRSGIKVETEITDSLGRLGGESEIALYRVVQECLTNIQRHAGTRKARIRIKTSGGQLIAEVQDFGKGFAPDQEGMGITGMRERMKELRGRLEIESGKKGTVVRAMMPLRRLKG